MKNQTSSSKDLLKLLKKADFPAWKLAVPITLSFVASLFDGLSAGLFIPVLQGLIEKDFRNVLSLPGIKQVAVIIPKLSQTTDFNLFICLLLFIALCSIIKIALDTLSVLKLSKYCSIVTHNLRTLIFGRYLIFGKTFFDNQNHGQLIAICKSYTNNVAMRLMEIKHSLQWLMLLFVYLCIMFYISWKLTIFALILFPLHHFSTTWLIKKIKKSSSHLIQVDKVNNSYLSNAISSMTLINVMNQQEKELENYVRHSKNLQLAKFSSDKKIILLDPIKQVILLATIFLFILAIGYMVSKTRSIDISTTLVFLYLLRRSAAGFGSITAFKSTVALLGGELSEILKIFDNEDKFITSTGKMKLSAVNQGITLKELDFTYNSGTRALEKISFFIPAKKTTALVGKTGSGKTTLVNLILRLYDCTQGSIFIDQVDIKEFDIASLREKVAYISQENYLFNDSIKNNLTYGIRRSIADDEVSDVLERTQLKKLIDKLPDGINSIIGDKGVKLSGGEKQRVVIARAFLQNPELIIMDEATSALDSTTEIIITSAMGKLIKDKTTIVIAHRLSTIKDADKIVVLDKGTVVEQGSLAELLENKGHLYDLWSSQFFLDNKSNE